MVGVARTPQGRLMGALASLTAVQLGALAIGGALERGEIAPDAVDAVVMGQVLQAGCGQNPARQAALAAGIGWTVPAITVNKVCLSGLAAIIDAARMVALAEARVVVAGGMESMSRAPHLLQDLRSGARYGSIEVLDHLLHDGLTDAVDGESMGASTERHNARHGVTRQAQDAVALRSHLRAAAAQESGLLAEEILPVEVHRPDGTTITVTQDEGVRPGTTAEKLADLPAAFAADGTITAGNASQISDGAAAVVLTTRAEAHAQGWDVLATLGPWGQVAGPDNALHSQAANAIRTACAKAGVDPTDLDVVEINEAFGAVVARSQAELGLSDEVVNPHGGGIALGHPIGASGARLVVTAVHELLRRGSGMAAVGLCGGGGQGEAVLLTR